MIILISLFVTFFFFLFYKSSFKKAANNQKQIATQKPELKKDEDVELPKNNFDTEMDIPETNFIFKYPKDGFYGKGANLIKGGSSFEHSGNYDFAGIWATKPIEQDKVSEFIKLSFIHALDTGNIEGKNNLKNAVDSEAKIYDLDGIKNGQYMTINNIDYYVFPNSDNQGDLQIWTALFLCPEGLHEVNIQYLKPINTLYGSAGDTPENRVAYKNNDALFLEILHNIRLK